jgi:hypothetical protein
VATTSDPPHPVRCSRRPSSRNTHARGCGSDPDAATLERY